MCPPGATDGQGDAMPAAALSLPHPAGSELVNACSPCIHLLRAEFTNCLKPFWNHVLPPYELVRQHGLSGFAFQTAQAPASPAIAQLAGTPSSPGSWES